MMKKNLLYFLSLIVIIAGCSKKDDKSLFDKSPDERLNETLAAYQTELTGSQFGWKAVLYTDSGRGTPYSFYFKFNDSNRVQMLSDFDSASAVTLKESSYRLKALQQPSLIFDTYSYIHVLADPNPNVNGGNVGSGLQTDFEFYFDSVGTDTIKFGGRFNGNKLVLIRATQQEANAYNAGQLAASFFINKIVTYFKRLTIGSQSIDIQINPGTRTIVFTWIDASGAVQTFSTTYYLAVNGIVLNNPLIIGSLTIKSLDGITLNSAAQTINLTVNGAPASIKGIVVPLKVDVGSPRRWWQYALNNGNNYWFSVNGFHINGVEDAYNVNSLTSGTLNYYFYIYFPAFGNNNDFFGPIFLNATQDSLKLVYGSAPATPTFTSDGRAVFTELGTYGTNPTTGPAAQTRALLFNSSGYYFVQTSPTSYDMVSAADGKAWITWQM